MNTNENISDMLIRAGVTDDMQYKAGEPVWHGPQSDHTQGGITNTLIGKYLVCKERFRAYVIDGWKTRDTFSHRLEYGNMWHLCEEVYAREQRIEPCITALHKFANQLCDKYPSSQEDIDKWYNCCKTQFPIYVQYWSKRKDTDIIERQPMFQEESFKIPYTLSSGRTVYLRGKWDSVDLIAERIPQGTQYGIFLQENKTKADIDQSSIEKQLTFDLQTMLYMIALDAHLKTPEFPFELDKDADIQLTGVIYNVVRRPLSGGLGMIKQKEGTKNTLGETKAAYWERVKGVIDGTGLDSKGQPYPGPGYFFMRWKVAIDVDDMMRFKVTCLDPILENLCDDYEWWTATTDENPPLYNSCERHAIFPHHYPRHFIMPYGVWNPLADGGTTPLDDYVHTGSTLGLDRVTNLFPELQT